jgi:hypothetical protein
LGGSVGPGYQVVFDEQATPVVIMSMFKELTSGGVAGGVGIIATQPMDTIRVRLQSQNKVRYSGIMDATMSALRAEGVSGLYKGIAAPVLTVGLMNAVLFFSYESAVSLIKQTAGVQDLSLAQIFLAGSMSGFASAFVTAPTELVKCIAQMDTKSKGTVREKAHTTPYTRTLVRSCIRSWWEFAHSLLLSLTHLAPRYERNTSSCVI